MPRYTNAQIIEALQKGRGVVSVAARALGCSRWVIDERIRKNKKVKAVYDEERQRIIEAAEDAITSIVADPKHPKQFEAARYITRTLGKDKGYTYRDEVEHSIPTPDKVIFVPIGKPAPDNE